jgi:Mg2+ and Co2+ transporter CorA
MDLKVIEPIEKPLKFFSTVDEFNLFYNKNKEIIDKETTHKLNRIYHIEGYRITKLKGILSLKKWEEGKKYYKSKRDAANETMELKAQIAELTEQIGEVTNENDAINEKLINFQKAYAVQLEEIKNRINDIVELINGSAEV